MVDRPPRLRGRCRSGSVEVDTNALRINAQRIGRTTDINNACGECEAWRQRCSELRQECDRRCSELQDAWRRRCSDLERALANRPASAIPSCLVAEVQTESAVAAEVGTQACVHLQQTCCQTVSVPCGYCRGAGVPPETTDCGLQIGICLDAFSDANVQTMEVVDVLTPTKITQTRTTSAQTKPRPTVCEMGSWACLDDLAHINARQELLSKIDTLMSERDDLRRRHANSESENKGLQMQLEWLMCDKVTPRLTDTLSSSSSSRMSQHQRRDLHDRFAEFSRGPLDTQEFNNRLAASVAIAEGGHPETSAIAALNHNAGGDAGVISNAAKMLLKKVALPASVAAPDLPKRLGSGKNSTAVASSNSSGLRVLSSPKGCEAELVRRRTVAGGGEFMTKHRSV